MAQALSQEEFQRMQVPFAGEKTTGLGEGRGWLERVGATGSEKGLVGMDLEFKGLVRRRETEALSSETWIPSYYWALRVCIL